MGLEQFSEQQYREIPDKFVEVTATYQMKTYDYVVRTSAAAATDLTMPPVAEAKGRIYSIRATTVVTGAVTVKAPDAEGWTNLTIDAANDGVLLYSDGRKWWKMANEIA